jgi:hypothetical protein
LDAAAEMVDGSGIAVRFMEHPARCVLHRSHMNYTRLVDRLNEIQGKYVVFVLDLKKQRIVDVKIDI